jgi:hypothetical protein
VAPVTAMHGGAFRTLNAEDDPDRAERHTAQRLQVLR